ncbi:hypothetical protein ABZ341_32550 [Streptomyces sp. NPDC006173]|uniref:hypothetical protein n=1 Tax=Streptomyces sp. NPDC006173 TaxID=3155349 RepID=UPI0033DC3E7B
MPETEALDRAATEHDQATEPSTLAVSARIAQLLLAEHESVDHRDLFAVNRAHGALAEALRILLRAVGVEGLPDAPVAARAKGKPQQTDDAGRGCGAPASLRIEGYSPARGSVYGSLDLAVYACREHAHEARTGWLGGRQPHTSPSAGSPCGHVFDYSLPGGGK